MNWDIITVTLNAEGNISRCINSVKNQKLVEVVHTIFDGGSTDGTQKIVKNLRGSL